MTQWIERAFCFSKKEYLVLLSLGGISQIYSFELPGQEELGREDTVLALHGLIKEGFVTLAGETKGPVLSPELKSLTDVIRGAGLGLTVMPGRAGNQQIIYLGEEGGVITELSGPGDEIHIRPADREQVSRLLLLGEGLPAMPFLTEEEGERIARYQPLVREEQEALKETKPPGLDRAVIHVMEKKNAAWVWELTDLSAHINLKRVVFWEGRVNSWILRQTEEENLWFFDSQKGRTELVHWLLEDKEGIG